MTDPKHEHTWRKITRLGGVLVQNCACGAERTVPLWPTRPR